MSKNLNIEVSDSGFIHPADKRVGLGSLPIHTPDQLRSMTKALNDGLPWNLVARQAEKNKKK
jgi:hypothetical protein